MIRAKVLECFWWWGSLVLLEGHFMCLSILYGKYPFNLLSHFEVICHKLPPK